MIEDSLAPYPGRGVVHHVDDLGRSGWVYFLTGRSPSSRRRRIRLDDDALVVESVDVDEDHDALRHYTCAKRVGRHMTVIGNGDHVEDLASELATGSSLRDVVAGIDPEPDSPIYTPRIALLVAAETAHMVAVRRQPSGHRVDRDIQRIENRPSTATVLTTYSGTVEEPMGTAPLVTSEDRRGLEDLAGAVWDRLAANLRVALVAGHGLNPEPTLMFSEHPRR